MLHDVKISLLTLDNHLRNPLRLKLGIQQGECSPVFPVVVMVIIGGVCVVYGREEATVSNRGLCGVVDPEGPSGATPEPPGSVDLERPRGAA